jgi:tryptophan-rich sensory protein
MTSPSVPVPGWLAAPPDWPRQAAAWAAAAAAYGAAQGLSAWAGQRLAGRRTRPQYRDFDRPAFAPPGAVFPAVWSALNLATATSAWRVWRAGSGRSRPGGRPGGGSPGVAGQDPGAAAHDTGAAAHDTGPAAHDTGPAARDRGAAARRAALRWWAAAIAVRSGYVPLAFGGRRFWAATADSALLCAMMARYAMLAREVDPAAAVLAVPETAWTAFATVLSAAVARKNN